MSLTGFQRAFAELIASPQRCLAARRDAEAVLSAYDLTERERRRLTAMINDHAMSVNCTLFRVNRLTPLYSVMPMTCRCLGDRLAGELDLFWAPIADATLQYGTEARRFAAWLEQRIESGHLPDGLIEDVIRFELAAYEVRTAPRDQGPPGEAGDARKRLLRLRYGVESVLAADAAATGDPPPARDEWVLLDASGDSLEVHRVDSMQGPQ